MGKLPVDICQTLGECTDGCTVMYNQGWRIHCQPNMMVCKELSSDSVACLWNNQQFGGILNLEV